MKSKIIIYIIVIVTGILITLLLRQVGRESVLHFISKWIELKFLSKHQNGTSLALLTLVEPKKPAFSVVVLPKQEIETGTDWVLNSEVNTILQKAIQLKTEGNIDKAMKLLKKCKALSPKHPDVLNYFGEGLEQNNIIEAEHHYALALVLYPGHLKAIENRRRCLPRVKELDLKMLQRIEEKREALMKIPEGNSALTRAKLEAYYKHIYHTNGIEGNTMTLSMTRSVLETGMAIGGKSVIEHNEILGLDAALKFINVTLLNEPGPVTLEQILQIHRRVLGYADPVEAGVYRQTQVFVGEHRPPSPLELPKYMESFQNWLFSADIELLHAIELAALAHYKLVYIHPFIDGNGRTSRLLMNLFLMKAGYPPVIIRKEQRFEYYEMLQTANNGDVRPFIRFVARCTEETLDDYLSSVTVGKIEMNSDKDGETNIINFENECFNPFHQASSLTTAEINEKCLKKYPR